MLIVERGNYVAGVVWGWLKKQQALQYVPWVLDPSSGLFDPQKAAEQKVRDALLQDLEDTIRKASEIAKESGARERRTSDGRWSGGMLV